MGAHPQGSHLVKFPRVPVERHASSLSGAPPSPSPYLPANPTRPLSGLRVQCVTHAIAGPSMGRTLAEHGASVLQIMFTHGFEHTFVYTCANLGTASSRLNLHKEADRERLSTLVKDAHAWVDSYRDGAISKFGFSDDDSRSLNQSIILCRVRLYENTGPWKSKSGFDMQGSASSGLMSLMSQDEGDGRPQWPPGIVINDYTTGYSAALAIQSIILKRAKGEVDVGDGWLVSPSLRWLRYEVKVKDGASLTNIAQLQLLKPEGCAGAALVDRLLYSAFGLVSALDSISASPLQRVSI